MRFGVTGHQRLDDSSQWSWVRQQIERLFMERGRQGDEATSALAIGADTLFAELALDFGLRLSVVIPCAHYDDTFVLDEDRLRYARLYSRAHVKRILEYPGPSEEAFEDAGHVVAEESDLLIAVWNGKPAAGRGGTGDIVRWARARGKEMVWLDPITKKVSQSLF